MASTALKPQPEPTQQDYLYIAENLVAPRVKSTISLTSHWKKSLENAFGNSDFVSSVYDKNARLKGTLADEPVSGIEKITDYFNHLFKHASQGKVSVVFNSIAANKDMTGIVGEYTFYYTDAYSGSSAKIKAFFEFKANEDGTKLIYHDSFKNVFIGGTVPDELRAQLPKNSEQFKSGEQDVLDRTSKVIDLLPFLNT